MPDLQYGGLGYQPFFYKFQFCIFTHISGQQEVDFSISYIQYYTVVIDIGPRPIEICCLRVENIDDYPVDIYLLPALSRGI